MSFVYTVDVEDWYQVENLRSNFPRDTWLRCESRIEDAMQRLLELCEQKEVKGTFFVLGWIAKRHPQIVKAIAAGGHEVACHGFNHEMLTMMDEGAVRQDILTAKALLEDTCGVRVTGYRAPSFSITSPALDILADLGFEYDSSLFPFAHHDRYGKIDISRFEELGANIYQHKDNGLLEFVLPLRRIGRMRLPWAGGGYFRLFPAGVYRGGVRAILAQNDTFIFYMHPWEIDPGQPYVKTVKAAARFRHYVGLRGAYRKLDQLLGHFGGTTRLADLAHRARLTRPAAA
jgi:polysaccharide deacetylase family protein (PEP-CTERM system associated)